MVSNIGNESGKPVRVPVTIKRANRADDHTHKNSSHLVYSDLARDQSDRVRKCHQSNYHSHVNINFKNVTQHLETQKRISLCQVSDMHFTFLCLSAFNRKWNLIW